MSIFGIHPSQASALESTALHCTYIKITTLENFIYTKKQKNKPTNIFSDFIDVLSMRGATGGQIYLNLLMKETLC